MIAMLSVFAILFVILPKKTFSETENRMLKQFPEITVKDIVNGDFQKGFEEYLSDQFPLRDTLLSVSVRTSRALGNRVVHDVIYAADENGETRLIDLYKKPQNREKFTNGVMNFSGKLNRAKVTVLLLPTAIDFYREELPELYKMQDSPLEADTLSYFENAFGEAAEEGSDDAKDGNLPEIQYVRGYKEAALSEMEAGHNIYYRTDHHWTIYGAYAGYKALAPYLGIPEVKKDASCFHAASNDFYGTTWSKVLDSSVSPDRIDIYTNPAWAGTLEVSYEDTGEKADSPYEMSYVNKKDQYSLFLNNQHTLICIKNPDADTKRCDDAKHSSLVIIKDSYANSLVPLLIDQYETIWVFDPRYYKGSISEWVNEHEEVEDVLIVYNLGTMDEDRGIGGIY